MKAGAEVFLDPEVAGRLESGGSSGLLDDMVMTAPCMIAGPSPSSAAPEFARRWHGAALDSRPARQENARFTARPQLQDKRASIRRRFR